MRVFAFVLALFLAGGPAAALDWMEYEYPDLSFTVHFPREPNVEMTTYRAPDGRMFDARAYSVALESGTFKLTVADLPAAGTDEKALVADAAKALSQGHQIKFDIEHRIRSTYGRQLGVMESDGSLTYVAVFCHKNRFYQVEAKAFVAGGPADVEAMIFHQSLDLT